MELIPRPPKVRFCVIVLEQGCLFLLPESQACQEILDLNTGFKEYIEILQSGAYTKLDWTELAGLVWSGLGCM